MELRNAMTPTRYFALWLICPRAFVLIAALGCALPVMGQQASGVDSGDEVEAGELPAAEAPITPVGEIADEVADETEADGDEALPLEDKVEPTPLPAEPPATSGDNPGQPMLDQALETKLTADSLNDLNEVVDLIDEALEEGLDDDNIAFAESVLVATLVQRANLFAKAILSQPVADPRRDPRWLKVRQDALTDLMRAVNLDDQQVEAWMLIGRLQSVKPGNASEARRSLGKVIRFAERAAADPNVDSLTEDQLAQAYALRGAVQKNQADRLQDFSRAIELAPDKTEYRLLRARLHQAAGRAEDCLVDIDEAIKLSPDNAAVHELKALALLMQDNLDEALESFDKASELAPEAVSPYHYRGEIYSRKGDLEAAVAQLDKALELSPNNLASLLIRAELLTLSEEHERALADIDAVLEQQPALVRAHLMRVRALEALGRDDEATQVMERLAKAAPERADLQLQLAAYYVDREQAEPAIEALTRVVELEPTSVMAYRLRGDMYLLVGKHAEALEDFRVALDLAPTDAGVLNNYAWTLATSPFDELRDGGKAIELAQKACEETKYEQAHVLSTLAASYAESGDFDEAIRWSSKAVELSAAESGEDRYDGQLQRELEAYQEGQAWREVQKPGDAGFSGPANDPAVTGPTEIEIPVEQAVEDSAVAPAAAEEEAPRSYDF